MLIIHLKNLDEPRRKSRINHGSFFFNDAGGKKIHHTKWNFYKKKNNKEIRQNTFISLGLTEREQPVRHFLFSFWFLTNDCMQNTYSVIPNIRILFRDISTLNGELTKWPRY